MTVRPEPFLLARLVTDQLRIAPVDTGLPNWRQQVSRSVETAFEVDLARAKPPVGSVETNVTALARGLLTTLTWALGAGFPEPEWRVVGQALTGREVGAEDISWVLDQLGRYVVQDGEAGVAVYRLAHQALADHLRPQPRLPGGGDDPEAAAVAVALLEHYAELLTGGLTARQPNYLWLHVAEHAAIGGEAGLDRLRQLAGDHPDLRPALAAAAGTLAARLDRRGQSLAALPPAQEAEQLYRSLAVEEPAFQAVLASAVNDLGVLLSELGRPADALPPTQEAVDLYRALAADNPAYTGNLAGALTNLGVLLSELGRRADALPPTQEALDLYRALAADNPAYTGNLASALNNLGVLLSQLGRPADALPPTEEAVDLRRALAADNPAYTGDLAMSLTNLGVRLSELGRPADARPPTQEALDLYRVLAADNPTYTRDLAGALNNLGVLLSDLGRPADALPATEEAVDLRRALAADNPAYTGNLAMALTNLGSRLSDLGRRADALPATEEAVDLFRALAADNPAYTGDLAMSLNNLGVRLSELGRRADALPPTEHAVDLYRALAADNPAYTGALASTLNNLGVRLSGLGRRADALPPTTEAVDLYRALATDNPAYTDSLASTLSNLGVRLSELGRRADALLPSAEAVDLYRALAADNPAYTGSLAMSLDNLGVWLSELDRPADALPPTAEAVDLNRALAADNPAFTGSLAMSLSNLGVRLSELDRHTDALPPTAEAVDLYRALAADNPAFTGDLAMSLNNLGVRLSELDRHTDALPPTAEAVDLYRALAADNPAYTGNLASSLNNLGDRLMKVERPVEVERAWRQALAALPLAARALLLLHRAARGEAGHPDAARWLHSALADAGADRGLQSALHQQARRHRSPDPATFDAAWLTAAGPPLPEWFTVDPDLLQNARNWIATDTYEAERDNLAANPELLTPDADGAVAEALLAINEEQAHRYEAVRRAARMEGAQAAYRPLLLRLLAHEFTGADAVRKRQLLAERRDDLFDGIVTTALNELAVSDDDATSNSAMAAEALLDLARLGQHQTALTALESEQGFAALLADLARVPNPSALAPTAILALLNARTEADVATARLYLAIAAATTGDPITTEEHIALALEADRTRLPDWITEVAALGAQHPQVLRLVPLLTAALTAPSEPRAITNTDGK
ncbi:tetratricopeptide repeat protein [Blastococcus sp. CT_GayMR19]|uniref:tetratricopeptide repeat protein n=1 Tax=Blastococcus sp. CT_GayMR19 TaxID=2559608 RepID=UPI0010739B89|nr:tetratricopeptide repeat protein [Blastococcus sp. CT_GayMR19]TFV72520.1 tetratricopeptide repeat protein [Blastococcus sp. CT_GayMR19]